MGIPEERKRTNKIMTKNFPQINTGHETVDLGSSKNAKKEKCKTTKHKAKQTKPPTPYHF